MLNFLNFYKLKKKALVNQPSGNDTTFISFLLNSFKLHIYSLAMDYDSRHQAEQKKIYEQNGNKFKIFKQIFG